jgi:hypothetical protein
MGHTRTQTRTWLLASALGAAGLAGLGTVAACSNGSSGGASPGTDGGTDAQVDSTMDATNDSSECPCDDAPPGDGGTIESGSDAKNDSSTVDGASTDAGDASVTDADAGPPQPVVLVTDAPNASLIATDGTNVYWVDWIAGDAGNLGRVMSVPVGGGTEVTLATVPGVTPSGLAIDTSTVYWTESDHQLMAVAKTGGTVTPLVTSGVGAPVTASGGSVYFVPQSGNGVSKVAADGGAPIALAMTGSPVDLVVVANDVFWADATGHIAFTSASAGGAPTVLVSPDPDAGPGEYVSDTIYQNITTDGTSLYWPRGAGSYPGAIMSLPVQGGSPQVVVNIGTDNPASVATSGNSVYFLDVTATSSLVTVPVGGGTPSTLTSADMGSAILSGTPGPTIAVDAVNVYWLNPPQIVKIAH